MRVFMKRALAATVAALAATTGGLIATVVPAQARTGLQVGMTPDPTEYSRMFSMYGSAPDVVRVFSSNQPPPWSDSRIQQLKQRGITPFISWKTYDPAYFNTWIRQLPADIPQVLLTHHHEPEGDIDAGTFKARQVALWNVVQGLPASLRTKVRYGAVLTRQWTENTAGRSYATYDPGIGDFLGNDMYVNSWDSTYPSPSAFMSKWLAYNTGTRRKVIPELGAVSLPSDSNDAGRAAFINGVMSILETSSAAANIRLVIWWDDQGTSGGSVPGLGTERNFRLHQKYLNGTTYTVQPSVTAWKNAMARNTP